MNLLRYQVSGLMKPLQWKYNTRSRLFKASWYASSNQMTCICCGSIIDEKQRRLHSTSCQSLASRKLLSSRNFRTSSSLLESHLYIPYVQPLTGIVSPTNLLAHGDPFTVFRRKFHVSHRNWKDEKSKVGKVVRALEKQEKEEKRSAPVSQIREVEKLIEKQVELSKVKKPILVTIKETLKHYFHGIRLFVLDLRVALRIAWNLARGRTLSRRERKQLVRTVSDIFRIVPFLVFVIVPFMEFLLPFYLKFFPFMLPSTFREEANETQKNLQRLKGKLEMAKFLQDTLSETSVVGKMKNQSQAQEFSEFLKMVRQTGKIPKEEDIMNYCSLFEDDITLDTLNHEQLKALCKLLDITAIGPSAVLRLQLEMRVRALKVDDYAIARDGGVEKMAVWELTSACRERGMRAYGLSEERLRLQLKQWLHLHLERHIPITLLLITRAMYLPDRMRPEEQLTEFILQMPQSMIAQSELSVAERTAEPIDPRIKIDVIKQEQEAIEKENAERKAKEELEKKEKEKEEEEKKAEVAPEAVDAAPAQEPLETVDAAPTISSLPDEELVDKAGVIQAKPEEELEPEAPSLEADRLSVADLEQLESAIASDRTTALDEEKLEDLQEEIVGYETDVRRLEAMAVVQNTELQESKAAKRLVSQVNKMIGDMTSLVNEMHKEKESLLEEIEVGEVRMRRTDSEDTIRELTESIASKKEKVISINDLMLSIRRMQRLPDETRWQKILEVLDEDADGKIEIHHVMKVLNLLGRDNVNLTPEQMARVLETIDKEAVEERMEMQRKLEQVDEVSEAAAGKSGQEATEEEEEEQQQKESGRSKQ